MLSNFLFLPINIRFFRARHWVFMALCLCVPLISQAACQNILFKSKKYIYCRYEPDKHNIGLFWKNPETNQVFSNLQNLRIFLEKRKTPLIFGMNAGMFNDQLAPIGLYIENSTIVKKINTREGPGNFHLKPNGVFYFLNESNFGVLDTDSYIKQAIQPKFATQSGPMLVINGKIHSGFSANSTSFKMRNGVGVTKNQEQLVFAISVEPVTFYEFADFFRTYLQAENALFLDGSLSSLYTQKKTPVGGWFDLGPLIGIFAK